MNKAEKILSSFNNRKMSFNDLLIKADKIGDAYENDWNNKITHFEFHDGSVAVFYGLINEIIVYGSKN